MAIRFTPSGLQSYDPLQDFKPKKEKATSTPAGTRKKISGAAALEAENKKLREQLGEQVKVQKGLVGEKTITSTVGGQQFKFTPKEWSEIVKAKFSGRTIGLPEKSKKYLETAKAFITPAEREELALEQRKQQIKEQRAAEKLETTQEIITPEIIQPQLEKAQIPQQELDEGFLKKLFKGEYTNIAKKFEEETGNKVLMGSVPIGGVPVPATQVASAAAKIRITALLSSKFAKWAATAASLFGVKTIADIPEKRMNDILAELRIMKTDMGRAALKYIQLGPEYSLILMNKLNEIKDDLDEYEEKIQKEKNRSYTQRLFGYGRYGEAQKYIDSLRFYLIPIEEMALTSAAGGEVDPAQLALIQAELEALE